MIRRSEFTDLKEIVDIIDYYAADYFDHVLPLVDKIEKLETDNSYLKAKLEVLEEIIDEMQSEINALGEDVVEIGDELELL